MKALFVHRGAGNWVAHELVDTDLFALGAFGDLPM
jgi:hypothetical protein